MVEDFLESFWGAEFTPHPITLTYKELKSTEEPIRGEIRIGTRGRYLQN
jgi:hypothetical protein